jgi:hypothetical protein
LFIADLFHNDTLSFLGGKTHYKATSLETEPEMDFHIFVRGWIDIWGGGGGCCLLWLGPGGNAQKGQGKSLTKFVF